MKLVTKLIQIKWVLRNGKVLMEDRGAVIVSNHQSSMDILGMTFVSLLLNFVKIIMSYLRYNIRKHIFTKPSPRFLSFFVFTKIKFY